MPAGQEGQEGQEGLNKEQLIAQSNQETEAFARAKQLASQGWMPPPSEEEYLCELVSVSFPPKGYTDRKTGKIYLNILLTFRIADDTNVDEDGTSLRDKKFNGWLNTSPNGLNFFGRTVPRMYGDLECPPQSGDAGAGLEQLVGTHYGIAIVPGKEGYSASWFINRSYGRGEPTS